MRYSRPGETGTKPAKRQDSLEITDEVDRLPHGFATANHSATKA
jgi:hypothetical protein